MKAEEVNKHPSINIWRGGGLKGPHYHLQKREIPVKGNCCLLKFILTPGWLHLLFQQFAQGNSTDLQSPSYRMPLPKPAANVLRGEHSPWKTFLLRQLLNVSPDRSPFCWAAAILFPSSVPCPGWPAQIWVQTINLLGAVVASSCCCLQNASLAFQDRWEWEGECNC